MPELNNDDLSTVETALKEAQKRMLDTVPANDAVFGLMTRALNIVQSSAPTGPELTADEIQSRLESKRRWLDANEDASPAVIQSVQKGITYLEGLLEDREPVAAGADRPPIEGKVDAKLPGPKTETNDGAPF